MSIVGKKKVSQQLVEFLLVVPFMVIILGILVEYAYALNINMTLTQGLKAVTSSYCTDNGSGTNTCYGIYDKISPTMDPTQIKTLMTQGFTKYLQDNNVPTLTENNVSVNYLTATDESTIFYAKYTYLPAFSLPNVYFRFLPDKFDFFASVSVPTAFLASNSGFTRSTNDLNHIWTGSGDLANPASFDSGKKGALNSSFAPGASGEILFLVSNPDLNGSGLEVRPAPLSQPYELRRFDLSDNRLAVDMANGMVYSWYYDWVFEQQLDGSWRWVQIIQVVPQYMLSSLLGSQYFQVHFVSGTNSSFSSGVRDDALSLGGTSNYDEIPSLSGYTVIHRGSFKFVYPLGMGVNIGTIDPGIRGKMYF